MAKYLPLLLIIGFAWGQLWNKHFGTDGETDLVKSIQETSDNERGLLT